MNSKGFFSFVTFLILVMFLFVPTQAFGAVNDSIDADVKLSVCGNGAIEGGEDCEGSNLNSQSCTTVGFGGGTLQCDVSCAFDTSGCFAPSATPSPTVTLSPTPTTQVSSQESSAAVVSPAPASFPLLTDTVTTAAPSNPLTAIVRAITEPAILQIIQIYDANGNGVLDSDELFPVVSNWVANWQAVLASNQSGGSADIAACDVNGDSACDLQDLSVLFFYVAV